MDKLKSPSDKVLYEAIMEMKEPVVFQHMLQNEKGEYCWKLLEWNLSELAEKFGDIKLPFRLGYNARSMTPQWEINCSTVSITLSYFIQNMNLHEDHGQWYYFDYKYMQEWFKDKPEIINSVNWKRFDIDKTGDDSTLWIGSKGAHTNCHQDSYGCNLVAQIHGRKQWLLFPPSSSNFLQPTRIPYEESTIYSKYNFFCPTKEDEINILKIQDTARLVILEPGDVLFVPPGWWHYVESLELTVSVNIWLPIITDNISRVKEAIVKLIVTRIGKDVNNVPNDTDCIDLLNIAIGECKTVRNVESSSGKIKRNIWTAKDLVTEYPIYVKLLRELSHTELKEFLRTKRERFPEVYIESVKEDSKPHIDIQDTYASQDLTEKVVNALCHPDVVNKVSELLLS
ncbi:HSPB1-associated protein 1 isoform X1 [Bombus pyrosoma]|uniref:HSPB1-associated protein 1 isoform X1 n=1 Tax=Bombus pyrosoma TaxID=396416 RepID=UPI001CB8EBD9|nr:HSPB1-associated protein 1 isoform X1 [Bombus pyrosoma]